MKSIRRIRPQIEVAEEPEQEHEDDTPDEPMEGETPEEAAERIVQKYAAKAKSPGKAIRAFCVACVGGLIRDVTRCTATNCPLYPFRQGRNPFHGRTGKPNLSLKKR